MDQNAGKRSMRTVGCCCFALIVFTYVRTLPRGECKRELASSSRGWSAISIGREWDIFSRLALLATCSILNRDLCFTASAYSAQAECAVSALSSRQRIYPPDQIYRYSLLSLVRFNLLGNRDLNIFANDKKALSLSLSLFPSPSLLDLTRFLSNRSTRVSENGNLLLSITIQCSKIVLSRGNFWKNICWT